MARTGADAIAWARNVSRYNPPGMCQQFTRLAFGAGGGAPSASKAWDWAKKKHPTKNANSIPAGVPVFWKGGSRGFGHVAVSLGNGLVRSTDWPRSGQVGTARITDISRAWNQRLMGWTEDINGVTVYKPKPVKPKQPVIDASNVARVTKAGKGSPNSKLLKAAVAKEVGLGSMDLSHGALGEGFQEQYKKVQRKYLRTLGQKPRKDDADGIPGHASLKWLGKKHGFTVKP